jgi:hypothetical protein
MKHEEVTRKIITFSVSNESLVLAEVVNQRKQYQYLTRTNWGENQA